jgi:2,5-diamino-6-(ribosylamino)-4(3H)-pyrimidinone 5'-phosphate reductase
MHEAKRPRVICHMLPSLDGRIVTTRWKLPASLSAQYDQTAQTFDADGWMIGRISMEPYAGQARKPVRRPRQPMPRKDFVATRAGSYAIALDPSGKLAWRSGAIDEDHVITVLTERVPDEHLALLQSKGISYVFGGKRSVNLKRVLEKLTALFGIETLLLEGGGRINGSFLAADLIDELSVLVAPIADGSIGTPTLFDAGARGPTRHLRLISVEQRAGDLLWLRYAVKR